MASEELKKTVRRVRAPRVEIDYEVEFYGATRKVVLPFVVGVFAPLSGERPHPVPVADRKFLHFDIENFDDRMRSMRPEVTLRIPEPSSPGADRDIALCFQCMSDFSPAAVARQVPALDLLLRTRTAISQNPGISPTSSSK
jgi:type VI secretion system protein ImpB